MNKIGHQYKDASLLENAVTHSSYANESKRSIQSNERLEFLGDAVLSIVVSDYLYEHYANMPEGELTKLRAKLVCEKSLAHFATLLGLDEHLLLGKGEENTGGRSRPSIKADAFEALIASLYLDDGLDLARAFIMRFILPELEHVGDLAFRDYKTQLQEIVQQNKEELLSYVLVKESGPDHDKRFQVEVHLNSNVIGVGVGRSKKEAEQLAAKEALELMGQ